MELILLKDKALIIASVASMIDQFNMRNIEILKKLGYKVEVACNFEDGNTTNERRLKQFKKELTAMGVEFYHIPIPRRISAVYDIIKSYRELKKLIKNSDYKIVHCQSPIGSIVSRLACIKIRKKGTKVIYTAHGFHFFKGAGIINWIVFYSIERFFSYFTDVLITINNEDYKRAKTFKAKKIEYLPGIGIDIERFNKINESKSEIKESLCLRDEDFVLISVGQLSKRKNHQAVIRAAAKLNKPDIFYIICGELKDELVSLAERLGILDRIIFTGYRSDVKRLLHGADCFVFPSTQEGLPVSLMEAMASGLACIASKIRGNTDLLEEENSEFLVDIFDIDGYSQCIKRFYENRELMLESGEKNYRAVKKFDKEVVDSQMKRIYEECRQ